MTLDGDLHEDGHTLVNGFFRKRRFAVAESEYSADLFGDNEHALEGFQEGVEDDSQLEAKKRKDRLEKEEFIRKYQVSFSKYKLGFDYNDRNTVNFSVTGKQSKLTRL